MREPLLSVEGLTQHFPVTRGVLGRVVGHVRAVDGVSFDIGKGETLGLVGESGCGKTTVGRSVLRLLEPTAGRIVFDGRDVTSAAPKELANLRRHLQIVFQDPYSSLNPRLRVSDIVGEALEVHGITRGAETEARVRELLRKVGLSPSWIHRYPHEFSGGQRQRIGIARAIATTPKLVVCDEAVSALDVSIQAQVLNLLIQLRREMGLAYLFIAHDLSVVRHVSHRVAVMYLGQIVELAPAKRLFQAPAHPYTRALLASIPSIAPRTEPRRLVLHGDVPSPVNPPAGCRFHTRCPAAIEACRSEEPATIEVEPSHTVKCVHAHGLAGDPDFLSVLEERFRHAAREHPEETSGGRPELALERRTRARRGPARHVPPPKKRPRSGGVLAAGALVLMLAMVAGARLATRRAAQRELDLVTKEIEARAAVVGEYPRDLEELGFRLFPLFDRGKPVDPWGHRLLYRAPGASGRPFDLGSTGPDGVPSRDDLGHLPVEEGKIGERR